MALISATAPSVDAKGTPAASAHDLQPFFPGREEHFLVQKTEKIGPEMASEKEEKKEGVRGSSRQKREKKETPARSRKIEQTPLTVGSSRCKAE